MALNTDRIPLGFDREDMPSVTSLDIYRAVQWMFDDGPVTMAGIDVLWFFNTSYALPSEAELHAIVNEIDAWQMDYELGVTTCWDFVHAARGEVAEMGFGKMVFGEVELALFNAYGTFLGYHEVILTGTQEGGRYFYEPQYPGDYALQPIDNPLTWIFPTADHADIVLLMF